MGAPLGLGQNLGRLRLPSLETAVVVVLGLYLYVFSGTAHILLPAAGPGCGRQVPRCCRFRGSPSTLRDTVIVFSSHDVGGS